MYNLLKDNLHGQGHKRKFATLNEEYNLLIQIVFHAMKLFCTSSAKFSWAQLNFFRPAPMEGTSGP